MVIQPGDYTPTHDDNTSTDNTFDGTVDKISINFSNESTIKLKEAMEKATAEIGDISISAGRQMHMKEDESPQDDTLDNYLDDRETGEMDGTFARLK